MLNIEKTTFYSLVGLLLISSLVLGMSTFREYKAFLENESLQEKQYTAVNRLVEAMDKSNGTQEPKNVDAFKAEEDNQVYLVDGGMVIAHFTIKGDVNRIGTQHIVFVTSEGVAMEWYGSYLISQEQLLTRNGTKIE